MVNSNARQYNLASLRLRSARSVRASALANGYMNIIHHDGNMAKTFYTAQTHRTGVFRQGAKSQSNLSGFPTGSGRRKSSQNKIGRLAYLLASG
jgi:hypothetical protein